VIDRTAAKRKLLKLSEDSRSWGSRPARRLRGEGASGLVQCGGPRPRRIKKGRSTASTFLQATSWPMAARRGARHNSPTSFPMLIDGKQVPPRLWCRAETIVGVRCAFLFDRGAFDLPPR